MLETIIDFGIGYFSGDKGLMVGRVVIPIHNVNGEAVAYIGRWPGDHVGHASAGGLDNSWIGAGGGSTLPPVAGMSPIRRGPNLMKHGRGCQGKGNKKGNPVSIHTGSFDQAQGCRDEIPEV
jgi:hypothetical protein